MFHQKQVIILTRFWVFIEIIMDILKLFNFQTFIILSLQFNTQQRIILGITRAFHQTPKRLRLLYTFLKVNLKIFSFGSRHFLFHLFEGKIKGNYIYHTHTWCKYFKKCLCGLFSPPFISICFFYINFICMNHISIFSTFPLISKFIHIKHKLIYFCIFLKYFS